MDAHVFRRLCHTLAPMLMGARLEKIQSPAEDVVVFSFYLSRRACPPGGLGGLCELGGQEGANSRAFEAEDMAALGGCLSNEVAQEAGKEDAAGRKGKLHLVLRAGRKDPFLYAAQERPTANAPPSALIMRWRKYCAGRRVSSCVADWTGRRLLLLMGVGASAHMEGTQPDPVPETWLVLDLRQGPQLLLGKSPDMPEEALWPSPLLLADACANWRRWPVLTPALRRTLPHLDDLDQQALLADLEAGGGDIFVYGEGDKAELWAWPLPPALAGGRKECVLEDPLQAVSALGDALVLGRAAQKDRTSAALPHVREAARLERLLDKLLTEEARLQAMTEGKEKGLALQEILWRFAPDAKMDKVATESAAYPELALDMRLTLRENMQAFFHQAARGRRGLDFMIQRRATIQDQLALVRGTAEAVQAGAGGVAGPRAGAAEQAATQNTALNLPRGVQAFRSSDGFIILRGKDAKGNWAVLRNASPQDLWLHVEGGPGAHAVIRRHYAGQDIPQRTLHEAASLAAIKSWQKDSPAAHILCAQVRHVKPMRGATPGTVRIDKVAQTFTVTIDAAVETLLAV